jgi:hypothetical protein
MTLISYQRCGWEEMLSKAKWLTEAKHYSKKIFDYLNTVTINDDQWRGTNKNVITVHHEYYRKVRRSVPPREYSTLPLG